MLTSLHSRYLDNGRCIDETIRPLCMLTCGVCRGPTLSPTLAGPRSCSGSFMRVSKSSSACVSPNLHRHCSMCELHCMQALMFMHMSQTTRTVEATVLIVASAKTSNVCVNFHFGGSGAGSRSKVLSPLRVPMQTTLDLNPCPSPVTQHSTPSHQQSHH